MSARSDVPAALAPNHFPRRLPPVAPAKGRQTRLKALAWPIAGLIALVLILLALAFAVWMPSNRALADKAEVALSQAAGVPVSVGALHWQIFPRPVLRLERMATAQPQPLTVERLVLVFDAWALLLHQRIHIRLAKIEGATIPQLSLHNLGVKSAAAATSRDATGLFMRVQAATVLPNNAADANPAVNTSHFRLADIPLERLEFGNVQWISRSGITAAYAGEVDFDAAWRPRFLAVQRPGLQPPVRLQATRQGEKDRWSLASSVGGGAVDGELQLLVSPLQSPLPLLSPSPLQTPAFRLTGQVQQKDIDVASAMAAFNRKPALIGKLSGSTRISASGDSLQTLAQSLRTQTAFVVQNPKLLGLDVEKAIRTAGKDSSGSTPLQSLRGEVITQNSAKTGMVIDFTRIEAGASGLKAKGSARLENQRLKGEFTVDLLSGLVGLPLKVEGPLEQLKVSVPASAAAGVAIGATVLQGIGTAIGAALGSIFGEKSPENIPKSKPNRPPGQ